MIRLATCVVLALLVVPAAASAATGHVTGGTLEFESAGSRVANFSVLPVAGGYVLRRQPSTTETLRPGPGCRISRPRELRCAGAIERIEVSLGRSRVSSFATKRLSVPITVHGSGGNDFILVGSGDGQEYGSSAAVSVDAGAGSDSVLVVGLPGVSYVVNGGAGRDNLEGEKPRGGGVPSFTLRGGAGRDRIRGSGGADDLEGGAGSDTLEGQHGSDTLLGGAGSDTAIFVAPPRDEPRLSVTLDGQANDGQPGENTLVGSDVEDVSFVSPFDGGPVPGGNTLVGNDGPNVLVGAGIVRGLGGNDVVVGASAEPNDLDGGDGNDRIGATVEDGFTAYPAYPVADKITCGNGDDTAFTDRLDPRPADCEHFNLGLHVVAATATVGRDGRAAVRISCNDIVPCDLGNVVLRYKNHLASEYSGRPRLTVAPGHSAIRRVRLNRWLRRPGRFSTLTVTATPAASRAGQPGEVTAGFSRVIKLIRAR